ncbi:hypothetical protein ACVLV4_000443 [Rathayibacter agropyri]
MAQKVTLVDDLDGSPITDGGGTVTFAIDNVSYEIDLNEKNADKLRSALAKFVESGRKVNAGRSAAKAASNSKKTDPAKLAAIRGWAKANGHDVSDRGRIAAPVVEAYEAANG